VNTIRRFAYLLTRPQLRTSTLRRLVQPSNLLGALSTTPFTSNYDARARNSSSNPLSILAGYNPSRKVAGLLKFCQYCQKHDKPPRRFKLISAPAPTLAPAPSLAPAPALASTPAPTLEELITTNKVKLDLKE
jgi:hypothetical protein